MISIHTNTTAINTLASLRSLDRSLSDAQDCIASGLRVRKAQDNAAYWSIATTLRGDIASAGAASDALNMSVSLVDTAYNGVTQSLDIVNKMKTKFLIAADATDDEKLKIETEIVSLRNAFVSVVKSSSFAGDNWLYKTSQTQSNTRSLVSGVNRNPDGSFSVQKTTVDLTSIYLIDTSIANSPLGILSRSNFSTSGYSSFAFSRHAYVKAGTGAVTVVANAGTTPVNAWNAIVASARILDLVTQDLTDAASQLGAIRNGLTIQQDFNNQMNSVANRSLGRLVDADMDSTSARTRALQVREQLGVQTLNIANSAPQAILNLFR